MPSAYGAGRTADGVLKVSGNVQMPNLSPAADVVVTAIGEPALSIADVFARTDGRGHFEMQVPTTFSAYRLHAHTTDFAHQAVLQVPVDLARRRFAKSLEIKLAPATPHIVTVLRDGKPVAGAHVAASSWFDYRIEGRTGNDGTAKLFVPSAGALLYRIDAWHPELGIGSKERLSGDKASGATEVSLLAPAPYRIRVLDASNQPVPVLRIGVSAGTASDAWSHTSQFTAAEMRTDIDGEVVVPWLPAENLRSVDVDIKNDAWKLDSIVPAPAAKREAVVRVRQPKPVVGRLRMPPGESAAGVLITGTGFGPANRGYPPLARAQADGTFTMHVASDHGYAIGVADDQWASNWWTGSILKTDADKPAEVTLDVYPATPITIRVVRGPNREPVADASLSINSDQMFSWISGANGEERRGQGDIRRWLRTDADGNATTGLGNGEHVVNLTAGEWVERRPIRVTSTDPVVAEFYREWLGRRKFEVQVSRESQEYKPSPDVVCRVWTPENFGTSLSEPKIAANGTFDFSLDAKEVALLVIDRQQRLSGFVQTTPTGNTLKLQMQPTPMFRGVVVDANGKPTSGILLRASLRNSRYVAVDEQTTDKDGHFQFDALPPGTPLSFVGVDPQQYFVLSLERTFAPGETPADERIMARR
jgi:hypothetical protein